MSKVLSVLTPYSRSAAIDLGNHRWRKQLLPIGDVEYQGRTLSFTKDYLMELARSFKDKAFDLIPFQLAPDGNKHTNDPERTRGVIEEVEVTDDGMYVVLSATDRGDEVIRENPSLGVSARIYENYRRSDGKSWTAALQHVLGTLDPVITGMKPWQEVAALSNVGKTRVLDLTNVEFTEEGGEPVALTDTDKKTLKDLLKKVRDGGSAISDDDLDEIIGEAEGTEEEISDEELDKLLADAEAEEAAEGETETETVNAANGGEALELANAQLTEQGIELSRVSRLLNEQAFTNEKQKFVHVMGLPPKAIELARPLLEGEGHVIELANGDQIDAGAIMRRVLSEIGAQIKILDLGNLLGNGEVPDEDKEELEREEKEREDFIAGEKARMGFK